MIRICGMTSLFCLAEREQEKQRLEKWSSELQQEREELELKAKQLSDSITVRSCLVYFSSPKVSNRSD